MLTGSLAVSETNSYYWQIFYLSVHEKNVRQYDLSFSGNILFFGSTFIHNITLSHHSETYFGAIPNDQSAETENHNKQILQQAFYDLDALSNSLSPKALYVQSNKIYYLNIYVVKFKFYSYYSDFFLLLFKIYYRFKVEIQQQPGVEVNQFLAVNLKMKLHAN